MGFLLKTRIRLFFITYRGRRLGGFRPRKSDGNVSGSGPKWGKVTIFIDGFEFFPQDIRVYGGQSANFFNRFGELPGVGQFSMGFY